MKTFNISKKKWLRGGMTYADGSFLCRPTDKKMCCIGIMFNKCKIPVRELNGLIQPYQISDSMPKILSFLTSQKESKTINSDEATEMMLLNDDADTSDEFKIESLNAILSNHGIELVLVD